MLVLFFVFVWVSSFGFIFLLFVVACLFGLFMLFGVWFQGGLDVYLVITGCFGVFVYGC